MKLAAKVLTASAKKIYENPEIIVDAKQELASRVGEDFKEKLRELERIIGLERIFKEI